MSSASIEIQPGLWLAQLGYLAVGLLLILLGAALLYTLAHWRWRTRQVDGIIVGVRQRGLYFHTVYRYAMPDGALREATSVQGGATLEGRGTGSHVAIQVPPDRPEEAREARAPATWALTGGLLLAGTWISYDAVTSWPHGVFYWLIVAAVAAFIARALWRRLARVMTALGRLPRTSESWSDCPVQPAEALGLAPGASAGCVTSRTGVRRSGLIVCLVGVLVLALAGIPALRLAQLRGGSRADGTVTRFEQNARLTGYSLFPRVRYVTPDGVSAQFVDRVGASPSPYRVGDHVRVLYRPGRPDTAMIDHGAGNWEPVGLGLLLGAVLLSFGLFSVRRPRGGGS